MKRRAVCFLLCLCFCFYSVSLKSSAADEVYDYVFTNEDLIDMGFIEYEEGHYINFDTSPLVSTFETNEKNFPEFNIITDLPWSTFPDYIKDILSMNCDDLKKTEGVIYVPFVTAVVTSSYSVQFFVGVNCAWGWLNNVDTTLSIWSLPDYPNISSNCILYRLVWDYSRDVIIDDWISYSSFSVGSRDNLSKVLTYNFTVNSVADFYCYGGNGIIYPRNYEFTDGVVNTGGVSIHNFFYDNSGGAICFAFSDVGFRDKHIIAYSYQFPYLYLDYFKPPTSEEILQKEQHSLLEEGNKLQLEENETSKSILEKITELPWTIREFFFTLGDRIKLFFEKLVEDIKGLFIPSDGFFDTYQQDFQTYFKERFGLLYEIPEFVINLLTKFVTFNPKEDDYSITFPEVKLPVLEDGEWREEKLIEAQAFSFDFINEAPFSLLYDAYVAFIWLVYILLLVNLIKYKANSVFKGG